METFPGFASQVVRSARVASSNLLFDFDAFRQARDFRSVVELLVSIGGVDHLKALQAWIPIQSS